MKNEVFRPVAMIVLMFCLLLGLTVNKASQEVTNVRMEVNDGGNIVVSSTDSNLSR